MSDQTPPAGGDETATGAAQNKPVMPQVQILAQYVKDLSFENPNAPDSLTPSAGQPHVGVNVDVRTRQLGEGRFEVVLHIRAEAKAGEQQTFLVELAYGGVTDTSGIPKELVAPVLLIEVPRLLFPFARAVIAEATREGGFAPLLVQPIDFGDLFRRQLAALKERQQQSAGNVAGNIAGNSASDPSQKH